MAVSEMGRQVGGFEAGKAVGRIGRLAIDRTGLSAAQAIAKAARKIRKKSFYHDQLTNQRTPIRRGEQGGKAGRKSRSG
jgi:uncharacterized protein YoaH (UPF0181 family)